MSLILFVFIVEQLDESQLFRLHMTGVGDKVNTSKKFRKVSFLMKRRLYIPKPLMN